MKSLVQFHWFITEIMETELTLAFHIDQSKTWPHLLATYSLCCVSLYMDVVGPRRLASLRQSCLFLNTKICWTFHTTTFTLASSACSSSYACSTCSSAYTIPSCSSSALSAPSFSAAYSTPFDERWRLSQPRRQPPPLSRQPPTASRGCRLTPTHRRLESRKKSEETHLSEAWL